MNRLLYLIIAVPVLLMGCNAYSHSTDTVYDERLSSEFVESIVGNTIKSPCDKETEKLKSDLHLELMRLSLDLDTAQKSYAANPSVEILDKIDKLQQEIGEINKQLNDLGVATLTENQVSDMFNDLNTQK